MKPLMSMFATLIILLLVNYCFAGERIVIIAPSAADIIYRLDASDMVVGKTKYIEKFKNAKLIGSHLKPNTELILDLNPTLIITMESNIFLDTIKSLAHSKFLVYDPRNTKEIVKKINQFGNLLDKKEEANNLLNKLEEQIKGVKKIKKKPTVLFEISSNPLLFAGRDSIIYDIITKAGGIYPIKDNKKIVKASIETIYKYHPDVYIYQIGPMNKNPIEPEKREYFKDFKDIYFLRVNQIDYLRANTKTFNNILSLNNYFQEVGFK
ncbi:MAG: ABC transporter substrate-binding protein [Deferribacterota bacterium]|nr:ABC transporter substrate-binding protein [Deferribacterota bacterium]